jgi:urease accessory protein
VTVQASEMEAAFERRRVEAKLRFARSGRRSFLQNQYVPYPFHVTRPFQLDPEQPHLATLYLQSASGGLYRDDQLALSLVCDAQAAAHITTQSATIVHDTKGKAASQDTHLIVAEDAFLAFTPDPTVLFSGAHLASQVTVTLAEGATAFLADAYGWHDPWHASGRDPHQAERPFAKLETSVLIRTSEGRRLAVDRGILTGAQALAEASPLGPYKAVGTFFFLGARAGNFDPVSLLEQLAAIGCLAGSSALPGDAGQILRLLAPEGGILKRGLEMSFAAAFTQLFGTPPAPRRK